MQNLKMEDLVDKVVPTSETTKQEETKVEVETETKVDSEQDPLKTELERVQKDPKKALEKAEKSLHFNAQKVKELGGDPNKILGVMGTREEVEESEDDKPVTRAELRKMMASTATKTAMQLADEITDNTEKELVKYYLENRITASGDSQLDFKDARRLVNSLKNEQIIQETSRKTPAKTHSSASGVDAKQTQEVIYTAAELDFMRPPFNATAQQILDARAGKKFSFKNSKQI